MRLSELLHSHVVDADGTNIGKVDDVRLVQDGPLIEGFGAALRVEGLIVGGGGVSVRLGYHRHNVKGPALLKKIFGGIERRGTYVPWESVASCEGDTVVLHATKSDLPNLTEVYGEHF